MKNTTYVLMFVCCLATSLFVTNAAVASDCPDADGDGHPESCYAADGEFIPSEDNCPTVANPDQEWGKSYTYSDATGWAWTRNRLAGYACNYDVNGDGIEDQLDFNYVNQEMLNNALLHLNNILPTPIPTLAVGNFGGLATEYDVYDLCRVYKGMTAKGIYIYTGNTYFLSSC